MHPGGRGGGGAATLGLLAVVELLWWGICSTDLAYLSWFTVNDVFLRSPRRVQMEAFFLTDTFFLITFFHDLISSHADMMFVHYSWDSLEKMEGILDFNQQKLPIGGVCLRCKWMSNEPAKEPPKLQLLIGSHQTSAAKAVHTANMANRVYRQWGGACTMYMYMCRCWCRWCSASGNQVRPSQVNFRHEYLPLRCDLVGSLIKVNNDKYF